MNLLKQLKNLATDATTSSSSPAENWYITAERAEGIKDIDRFSKSDPYLKISFGGSNVRTRTIKNDRSPYWNETFNFKVNANHAKEISIKLVDDDVGLDDTIGSATISRVDFLTHSGEEKQLKVPVLNKEQICGIVYLRIKKVDGASSSSSNYQSSSQQQPSSYNPQQQYHPQQQMPSSYNTQQPMNTNMNAPPMMNQSQHQQPYQQPYQQQPYQQQPYQQQYQQPNSNYGGQYQQR